MTPVRKRRLATAAFIVCGVSAAAALALVAFERNLMFFYTPSQIAAGEAPEGVQLRVGGIVEPGSVKRTPGSLRIEFSVSDLRESVVVSYEGLLPDLFREGQGVVALGMLAANGQVAAGQVLAKHDENYQPPEVADALKQAANR